MPTSLAYTNCTGGRGGKLSQVLKPKCGWHRRGGSNRRRGKQRLDGRVSIPALCAHLQDCREQRADREGVQQLQLGRRGAVGRLKAGCNLPQGVELRHCWRPRSAGGRGAAPRGREGGRARPAGVWGAAGSRDL